MKISLKWLKDYIDIEDLSSEEVLNNITISGLEVDEIEDKAKTYQNIVIGFVKSCKKHPNADKLSVCIVNDGSKDYDVVCGAPNVAEGQKIVFAKVGSIIPSNGMVLKRTKIRGEVSEGMICAEDELGIGDDHSGIMVLDDNAEVGLPFAEFMNFDDVIAEIDITPNRADALSHVGVARDLAAIYKKKVNYPEDNFIPTAEDINNFAKIEIDDEEGCPRYSSTVIRDVTISESPTWLKKKITAIGLRPINNVVDITNFILYELGQPLHAFDLDQLADNKIIVRKAGSDKKFVSLDSKERELDSNDLMICDSQKPIAIAGVMGGENSEVTNSTKNILIESAYFNPSRIRKTAKRLNLSTDASYRFERGCNPEGTVYAAKRAAALIAELTGGKIADGVIDVYPKELKRKTVKLRFARIERVLGYEVSESEVKGLLIGLGFDLKTENPDYLEVEVPLFRHDIEREIDLIEEVARIFGYDNIPLIKKISVTLDEKIDQSADRDKLRQNLTALGYHEIITNSLLNFNNASIFGNPIEVMSPQSLEMSDLRTSLIPGGLMTISRNIKVKESSLKIFEIGHVFSKGKETINSFDDFVETENLLMMITGNKNDDEWFGKKAGNDFFDLKGDIESLFDVSKLKNVRTKYITDSDDTFTFQIQKIFKKKIVGFGGKLSKKILEKFDVDQDVYFFDLNLKIFNELARKKKTFSSVLKYPTVNRDFAFIVNKEITCEKLISTIKEGSSNLLKNIKLFDIFESGSLGSDKKSMAFKLEYYDDSRTLTEEEVDKDFWGSIEHVKNTLNAKLRG